ncbi:GNAT family N-acetyltransferase [Coralloluteibacterium thermophilus]|uniref:GNAT family N-acetyltransferase n=1 Tax=Coralloluteibacterium thermophilum TaxID=2707049 RepID=A0ABV9NLU6_9GAMM
MIRAATHDDIPAIVEMGRKFYATTSYPSFAPFNPESVAALARMMIDTGVLLVADEGELVGMAGLVVCPFMFNADVLAAHEVMWWVDPDAQGRGTGKALLSAIEPACRARGVGAIQMVHLHNSPPQAAVLYERLGYRHSESSYTKVLTWQQ